MSAIAGLGVGMSLASAVLSGIGAKEGAGAESGGTSKAAGTGDTTTTVTNADGSITTTVRDGSGKIISVTTTQPSEASRHAAGNTANPAGGQGSLDISA
jgi:cellulose 1,4-beta-cellobiosidase